VDPVTEQVVKGNDPHGGRGRVCERDMARVRVGHRMAGQNYRVLGGSKICLRFSVDVVCVRFKFSSFPDEPIHVPGFSREEFCVLATKACNGSSVFQKHRAPSNFRRHKTNYKLRHSVFTVHSMQADICHLCSTLLLYCNDT